MRRGLVLLLAALALAPAAAAKEGVHARLTRPIPLHASAGTRIVVTFTLRDAAGRPFDAARVFVKLTCPERTDTSIVFASASHPDGRYRVVATVPPGGLGRIAIGLRGSTAVYFPIANNPLHS